MAAITASMLAVPVASAAVPARKGLAAKAPAAAQAAFAKKTVSNGSKTVMFQVWQPTNNKFFETFSFLPPLSSDEIARQVDYITRNGWTPCLEFSDAAGAYIDNTNCTRINNTTSGYYDNRYWAMYKLPMFGCTDSSQVLKEIDNCTKTFPDAYIRLVAFDAIRQVQIAGLLVHRPPSANEFRAPSERSI